MTDHPVRILRGVAKNLAWQSFHVLLRVVRFFATCSGKIRRVDVIIYKVDRMGDWLLAEPSIARLVAATQSRGGTIVIWAGQESTGLRKWRPAECPIETLVFEPRGWIARTRRTWTVIRLLATYRADTLYCLRHGPDPIRDFVLQTVAARNVHALSWRIFPGNPEIVPHEIRRHDWILRGGDIAPDDVNELLPRLSAPASDDTLQSRIIVAPFSSALVKDWPVAAWNAVAAVFASQARVWELWVGPDQIARAQALAESLARQRPGHLQVTVRSGSLAELASAIASARLVLTVDTLAAHIAAALDAPMVGILGGGQYGDFAPWSRSERQRWVSHPLPCFNCGWHCTRAQNDCLQLITPAAVLAEMQFLWNLESRPRCGSTREDEPVESPLTDRS